MSPEEEKVLQRLVDLEKCEPGAICNFSPEEIGTLQTLAKIGLSPLDACRIINGSRVNVKGRRKKPRIPFESFAAALYDHPGLRDAFLLGLSEGKANVMTALYNAARKGNVAAIKHYMATVSHRQDAIVNAQYNAENGGEDIAEVIITIPDNSRKSEGDE